jgi:hypothetical protein
MLRWRKARRCFDGKIEFADQPLAGHEIAHALGRRLETPREKCCDIPFRRTLDAAMIDTIIAVAPERARRAKFGRGNGERLTATSVSLKAARREP